ncbi:hypothetical protein L204_104168 [Cryptococcus depauperatus]|nr:hypothetical protein L204_05011 [Cryptococcus depauperatus CBS 7855]
MTTLSADIRLYKQRASYSIFAALHIFSESPVAHVAFIHPGDKPGEGQKREETLMNLPLIMVIVQDGEDDEDPESYAVYLHTHKHAGVVEAVQRGLETLTATTTQIDGMILSPTAHNHTLNYRSATLHLYKPSVLCDSSDHAEKTDALAAVTNTVVGYDRIKDVGMPIKANVEGTAIVRCRIKTFSCKQRYGAFSGEQEPILDAPENDQGQAFQGVVPCWTQWGQPLGFGRDRAEVKQIFKEKGDKGRKFSERVAWANEDVAIEGLGKRRGAQR